MKVQQRALLVFALLAPSFALADWRADIGYTSLQARLGSATPDGTGIDVTQVEALYQSAYYLPNPADTDFTQPPSLAKVFTPECLTCNSAQSAHATIVGRQLYGNTVSTSPGIIYVDVNEANNWLNRTLNCFTSALPSLELRRIQNQSWQGAFADDANSSEALQRFDLTLDRDGVLACVAANNGTASAMPKMLASAYNALTVGLSSGGSSYGPTLIDNAGRVKPDIVAPNNLTSYATPMVGSCAALLLQTMDASGYLSGEQNPRTARALTTKALLMAGATKDNPAYSLLSSWRKGFATPSTNGTVPLDYRFGAGMVNIDNSHRILTAGEQNASSSSTVGTTGWDYKTLAGAGTAQYFFDIPPFNVIQQVSILVTWNRQIAASGGTKGQPLQITPMLANIDLKLYRATGFTKGALIDQSVSTLDNVEHIFLKELTGGRYLIEVTSDQAWEYAVAWDAALAPTVRPDLSGDGAVDDTDVSILSGCSRGASAGLKPGCAASDLDNDGDVDQDDFGILQRCYAGPGVVPDSTCYP